MRISSIIPIWIMIIICVSAIIFVINGKYKKRNLINKILIIVIIFLMNLRIMITSKGEEVVTNNLDVLFVIDNTISMLAEDYQGNKTRFSGVKEDCKYIVSNLSGARFSIMTFNDLTQVVTPYTRDLDITVEALETINMPNQYYAMGSSPNNCLDEVVKQLKSSNKKDGRKSIIFFISDGEITNEDKLKSFNDCKKYIDNGAVIGYGTETGGKMKVKNYDDVEEYLVDYTSLDYPIPAAVSTIDEDTLKSIANDMGIDYIHAQKQKDLDSKIKEIKKMINSDVEHSDKNSYVDTYFILSIPLLGLLIWEFIDYKKKL